jgi:hypothetical protein
MRIQATKIKESKMLYELRGNYQEKNLLVNLRDRLEDQQLEVSFSNKGSELTEKDILDAIVNPRATTQVDEYLEWEVPLSVFSSLIKSEEFIKSLFQRIRETIFDFHNGEIKDGNQSSQNRWLTKRGEIKVRFFDMIKICSPSLPENMSFFVHVISIMTETEVTDCSITPYLSKEQALYLAGLVRDKS